MDKKILDLGSAVEAVIQEIAEHDEMGLLNDNFLEFGFSFPVKVGTCGIVTTFQVVVHVNREER